MTIKKISVFCGAHLGKSPAYNDAAKEIGKLLASKKIELVFGGGNVGLMKTISDTVIQHGGRATGIVLNSLHEFELTNPSITETVITHSLFERKEKQEINMGIRTVRISGSPAVRGETQIRSNLEQVKRGIPVYNGEFEAYSKGLFFGSGP